MAVSSNALRPEPLALPALGGPNVPADAPRFEVERRPEAIVVRGKLAMRDAGAFWARLEGMTQKAGRRLDIDISQVERLDGSIVSLLAEKRAALSAEGVECEILGAGSDALLLLRLYGALDPPVRRKRRVPEGLIHHVGRATAEAALEARDIIAFVGEGCAAAMRAIRMPRTVNAREIIPLIERAGADAVPIVLLINFLVGFVMGFQSAKQLQSYGADLFVADIVGLGVTRELAPLMTAIILCGRTGAAFTAELGTMKVSEEIDALRAMGFSPMAYLVFPRLIALVVVVPALTVLGDAVGILGGAVVASSSLNIGMAAYMSRIGDVVHGWDVLMGLIKSVAYAGAIGLVACQRGLATSGGAEGVGKSTTKTVVTCLFLLIILDALLTVVFRALVPS